MSFVEQPNESRSAEMERAQSALERLLVYEYENWEQEWRGHIK